MFACVFHMFDVGCDWLEFIHKFTFLSFPVPRLQNCNHYAESQMAQKTVGPIA